MNESASHKNILSIMEYSKRNRSIIREQEIKLKEFENRNMELSEKIKIMENQLRIIQVKIFSGGSTCGH